MENSDLFIQKIEYFNQGCKRDGILRDGTCPIPSRPGRAGQGQRN